MFGPIRRSITNHKPLRWLGIAATAFLVAGLWSSLHWPIPTVHDEYSYLLGADTLAHGRFANPTPRFWEHFETFHVNLTPTYVSKYPLGSFVFLAIGEVLGEPVVGLWLGFACATLAIVWMARGALSWRWSLMSGLMLCVHPVLHACWTQSFMSGWPAVAFSAIYFGALLRLRRRVTASMLCAAILGLMGMGLTRPWEGLLTGVAGAVFLAGHGWTDRLRVWRQSSVVTFGPAVVAGAIGLLLWTSYNQTTTGRWSRMPYQEHERQYGMAPVLLFMSAPKTFPEYRFPEFTRFHRDWSYAIYQKQRTIAGFAKESANRSSRMIVFWGFSLGLIPLLTCGHWGRWRATRRLGLVWAALLAATCVVPWLMPHYMACMLPLPVLLATFGLQQLSQRWHRQPRRMARVAIALIAVHFVIFVTQFTSQIMGKDTQAWARHRLSIERQLAASEPKDLILVHYDEDHNPHREWVYNRSDLEQAPVIWAREMGPVGDKDMLSFYADRNIWRIFPDRPDEPLELVRASGRLDTAGPSPAILSTDGTTRLP